MKPIWAILGIIIVTGQLWISNASHAQYPQQQNPTMPQETVLFILDASESMNDRIEGKTKLQAAKEVIQRTVQTLPPHINAGLRVYGHRHGTGGFVVQSPFGMMGTGGNACKQTQLLVPPAPNNHENIINQLRGLKAVGKTPITYAVQEAVNNDLNNVPGKKTIILVSDGEENCSMDPCDLAVSLVRAGIDIKINTIGFATHNPVADDQLKCVAMSTKGRFYEANTAAELAKSLQDSTRVQTRVEAKIYPGP